MVVAYASAYAVSPEVAQERLDTQAAGSDIVTRLSNELGPRFTSVSFDNTRGFFKVLAVPSEDDGLAEVTDTIRRVLDPALRDRFTVEPARANAAQLQAEMDRLSDVFTVEMSAGKLRLAVNSGRGEIVITADPALDAANQLKTRNVNHDADVPVSVRQPAPGELQPVVADACGNIPSTSASCDRPLRGSVAIYGSVLGRDAGGCSPSVFGRSGSGSDYVVTAGHCLNPLGRTWNALHWSSGTSPRGIGQATNRFWDGRGDMGLVRVSPGTFWSTSNNPNYASNPWIGAWSEGLQEYRVRTIGDPFQGLFFGFGGSTSSGFATVAAYPVPLTYGGVATGNLMQSNSNSGCAAGGTSGGPYWNTNVIFGVHNASQQSPCIIWGTPVRQAVNIWGLSIYTRYP